MTRPTRPVTWPERDSPKTPRWFVAMFVASMTAGIALVLAILALVIVAIAWVVSNL